MAESLAIQEASTAPSNLSPELREYVRQPHHAQPGDGVNTASITEEPNFTDGYINDRFQEVVVFDPAQVAIVSEQPVDAYGQPV